jgi:hypothetical protein
MYSESFKSFVYNGVDKYYIGTGNPNAQILFIGKESALASDNTIGLNWYFRNANDWQTHISNNTCEILEYEIEPTHVLRKGWGRNTWSKYQKLSDYIREKKPTRFKVDFLNYIFTTEINDSPEKNTYNADKSSLINRKELLKKSDYIQGFPVIVLACSNYIKNNEEAREIDNIFGVTYDGDETGKYWYSKGNWFFTHHNDDRSRLVIHTRQLSADVKDELLKDLGTVIREHLVKIEKDVI